MVLAASISKLRQCLVVIFCLIFTLQIFANQAEHAGIITCSTHHSTSAASDAKDNKLAPQHCHCCLVATSNTSAIENVPLFIVETYFQIANESCPIGPVSAIDHPPQLS